MVCDNCIAYQFILVVLNRAVLETCRFKLPDTQHTCQTSNYIMSNETKLTAVNIDRHIKELQKEAIENQNKMMADDFMNMQQLLHLHERQTKLSNAITWLITLKQAHFPSKLFVPDNGKQTIH